MLASLNFIEKFVSLPKKTTEVCVNGNILKETLFETKQIASILTQQGFEVDGIQYFGAEFHSVVVGKIEKIEKHPDAQRLNICFVNAKEESLRQIVCGALNVREGMYVAVALPGTKLPSNPAQRPGEYKEITFEIKSSTIRNVESHGMLCARSELGLTTNSDVDGEGIWDLGSDAQGGAQETHLENHLGYPVFRTLGLEDTLLDLSVTPNRPDVLCQQGVARELIAGFSYKQIPFEAKKFSVAEYCSHTDSLDDSKSISADKIILDVKGNAQAQCGDILFEAFNYLNDNAFFVLLELTEKQKHTPAWMRNLLEPLNLNSINLVVDISNFILVAYGQPNHAFDLNALDADNPTHKKLMLRHAHSQELFTALDGKERILHEADCIVSDSSKPQALLGVVGGENAKITEKTTKIVLEFANPKQTAVRHSARRHAKQTVASFMFEKGIDVASRFQAASDFVELLSHGMDHNLKYCTSIHSKNLEHVPVIQAEFKYKSIPLRVADQKKVLGTELIPFSEQLSILESLGFKTQSQSQTFGITDSVMVSVPTWRASDVQDTADLIEECIRVVGIDHVPAMPMDISAIVNHDDDHLAKIETLCNRFCALGYNETIGLNFMREDDYQKLNFTSAAALGVPVKVLNPVIGDEPIMQTTLIPDLLRKVERNVNYGVKSGQLFCSARTFTQDLKSERPIEINKIAGVCFGEKESKTWQNTSALKHSLHDIMSHMNSLAESLELKAKFSALQNSPYMLSLHPKKAIQFSIALEDNTDKIVGFGGELHPKVKRNYGCDGVDVYFFEINLDELVQLTKKTHSLKKTQMSLPRFPLISRDFSFIFKESTTSAEIEQCVKSELTKVFETELSASLKHIQIFDIYRGEAVSHDKKSVTFKIIVEPLTQTFTEKEIATLSNSVLSAVARSFSAEQRV